MGKEEQIMGKEEIPMVQGTPVPQQTIPVIAPSDLPQGYQFMAETTNGQQYLVQVPPGGVKAGQEFTASVSDNNNISSSGIVRKWKDGLCSCFSYGLCHAHLCLTCICSPIALAQLMTRVRLTWLGEPGSVNQVARTFKIVSLLFITVLLLDQILALIIISIYPEMIQDPDNAVAPIGAIIMQFFRETLQVLFAVYLLVTTCRTRKVVREQFNIPEKKCKGCEDCCCAFWCQCCVTMQMMRQTADYAAVDATCCTETGLPVDVV
mmetsp:Transcript_12757/g.18758  ORF Transcript_12757/g.18758 Transcript_12757/m.18758 type:complete len:264 (-) Transcript_12757:204-995(-)